jgi:hypothetical protein
MIEKAPDIESLQGKRTRAALGAAHQAVHGSGQGQHHVAPDQRASNFTVEYVTQWAGIHPRNIGIKEVTKQQQQPARTFQPR